MAKKALYELTREREGITVEEVDIIRNPLRALRDGVKFIPVIISGREKLSGILLAKEKIAAFLDRVSES